MTGTQRPPRRMVAALALLAALGAGAVARAQEDDDPDVPPAQPQQQQHMMIWSDDNFDQWVFGGSRNSAAGHVRLDSQVTLKVEEVEYVCAITEAQKKKLRLAARGDVKRFLDRVEEKRKKFQLVKGDQNKFQEFYQELQPLIQASHAGPCGEGSIFVKTLKTTLGDGQAARYESALREKRLFRYRAKIHLAVANLDNAVGMTAKQRQRLLKMLLDETRPPRKSGPYDYQVAMLQISRLPEGRVKPIFNDTQWPALRRQFDQARGMELFLTRNGYLPDDEMLDDVRAFAVKPEAGPGKPRNPRTIGDSGPNR